jgi:hypothetical protein
MYVPGVTYPINQNTPRDGRKLLVYGTAGWESLNNHSPEKSWHVCVWEPELTVDYESENYDYLGGFKTVTANPYKDYVIGTHWQVYPADPES